MPTHSYPPTARALRLRLQARPESALLLRQRLRDWLEHVGARGGDVFDIVLACAEAFANALEHPHEPSARLIDVDGQLDHGAVTVTLRDYGSWRSERERAEGGYGLPLMRTLMDTVELDTQAEGTSITMRRQLTRPALGHRDGNPATYEHDDGRADAGTACSFR